MTGPNEPTRSDRPLLPRDAFRAQRIGSSPEQAAIKPVVVTPAYGDPVVSGAEAPAAPPPRQRPTGAKASAGAKSETRPFEAYGERSSSRPYALRLPDAIDLALRTIAAEEHTHPLRVIDRILYEHLKAVGRLPPGAGA
jgi:hypothetical protein